MRRASDVALVVAVLLAIVAVVKALALLLVAAVVLLALSVVLAVLKRRRARADRAAGQT